MLHPRPRRQLVRQRVLLSVMRHGLSLTSIMPTIFLTLVHRQCLYHVLFGPFEKIDTSNETPLIKDMSQVLDFFQSLFDQQEFYFP